MTDPTVPRYADGQEVRVKRLSSGYYHLRGRGPCNFAQVAQWPCTEAELREGAFAEASEDFIRACLSRAPDAPEEG